MHECIRTEKGLGTALTEMYARRIIEMNIDFEKIRKEEWPVLETMTFLDAACVSFAPQRTVKAVKAFADMTAVQEEATPAPTILQWILSDIRLMMRLQNC